MQENFFKILPCNSLTFFYKMSNPFQIYLNFCFLHNHLLWLPSSPIPVVDEGDCCKTSQHIVILLLTFYLEKNTSVNCFVIIRSKNMRNNLKVIECKSDESCKFAMRMWLRAKALMESVGRAPQRSQTLKLMANVSCDAPVPDFSQDYRDYRALSLPILCRFHIHDIWGIGSM